MYSPFLSKLSARPDLSLVNLLGPCPQKRMSSRLVSLLGSAPFEKPGPSADFENVKGGRYLKECGMSSLLEYILTI